MTRLAIIALLWLPAALFAQEAPPQRGEIEVKPLLCIVDARTPSCAIRFEIAWRSVLAGYHCVTTSIDEAALRCWFDASAGEHEVDRDVSDTFDFRLNEGDEQTVLATATVEVLRKDSGDRRRKRRARHVWDLH
ncbi:MAG: DUF3019 domain-containing protein [Woeseiaceae bacterium]|nr:DUF3019 domain-containing protein [Woeseiaceae bacterium]